MERLHRPDCLVARFALEKGREREKEKGIERRGEKERELSKLRMNVRNLRSIGVSTSLKYGTISSRFATPADIKKLGQTRFPFFAVS